MTAKPKNDEPQKPRFQVKMFSAKTLGEASIQKSIIKDLGQSKPVKLSNHLPKK